MNNKLTIFSSVDLIVFIEEQKPFYFCPGFFFSTKKLKFPHALDELRQQYNLAQIIKKVLGFLVTISLLFVGSSLLFFLVKRG